MVTKSTRQGLIVSTSPQATPALGELIVHCGWPALFDATPQRFRRELLLAVPKLSLFWLDDEGELPATTQLLAWVAANQPAVKRVAVGYHLPETVEVAVRSAGASLYFPANGNLRELVNGLILQVFHSEAHRAAEPAPAPLDLNLQSDASPSPHVNFHATGPP